MPTVLLIPDDVPAADRRRVLARIRRDIGALQMIYDAQVTGPAPALLILKKLRARLGSLKNLEAAWQCVQIDGPA